MKRVFAIALLGLMFTAVLASCGSSKGGHCDAYGSVDTTVDTENTDLASL